MKVFSLLFTALSLLPCFLYAQWTIITTAPVVYYRDIMDYNGELFASTAGTGVYKSTDNGNTWQPINNGLISSQAQDVYQTLIVSGNLFAATTDGIYKSTDDGGSWVKKSNGITIGGGALYAFTESVFEYQGVLFTGAWNGIYYSTDGAENWNLTNISGEGVEAKNFTVHDGIIFAARESINSPIGYKSFDNGYTWQDLTGLSYFNTITFLSEPGKLWGGLIDGVWLSTDDGITWEDRSNGLSPDPYSSSILRINGTLVTSLKFGGSGVYKSIDDGLNWQEITDNLPFLSSIEKLVLYDGKIIAATSDGLWQRDISEIPVELTSFKAEYSGDNVKLTWSTATETNNKGFAIQRQTITSQWEDIGFVIGSGTTTERRNYLYTDKNISAGVYNYRLKQVDLDGKESYSNEIAVDVNTPAEFILEQNYPNPFNPSTNIGFRLKSDSKVSLNIYNILGQEKALLLNENLNAGKHNVPFDAFGLPSGIYFYSINVEGNDGSNFTATRKMLLLK